MLLQDLKVGEDITLEIMWGNSGFEMTTTILSVRGEALVLRALTHKGVTVDLGMGKFKDISYNIYAIVNMQRVGWKNVQIELVKLNNGEKAYLVKTYQFAKMSANSERRMEERTIVNTPGFLWIDDRKVPIKIYDISSKGISFYVGRGTYLYENQLISLELMDMVRGKQYDFLLNCKVARHLEVDSQEFIGCMIGKQTKDLLFYVFSKRLAMAQI